MEADEDEEMVVESGSIHRIELQDWKSYAGHHVIGPFKPFTAIIGPNGSGKSNLMDAVAFVLGEKTKSVRGNTLRELVHDSGKGEEHRPKRCHVTLVYLTSDGETHFTRAVTAAGTSEYRIDGAVSSYEAYDARLQTHGILLKAKNFLVFQGDVESIASKSPKELTALFELVSGSGALAADYVAAEEAKAAAESATSVAFAKRKGAMAQKKQKKEQKEEADKHLKLVEEVQELKLHRHLFSLASVESGRAALDAQLATLRSQQAAAAKRASVADAELASKKKEVAKAAKAAVLAEKEVAKASEAAAKLAPDALRNTEEASRAQKSLKTHEMTLVAAQQEAASNATKMREAETRLRKLDESVEAEQRQLALAAARGAEVVLTDALREEWKTVSEEAASRTSGMKADLTAAQSRHSGAQDVLSAAELSLREIDGRVATLSSSIEETRAREEQLQAQCATAAEVRAAAVREEAAVVEESRRLRTRRERLDSQAAEADLALSAERAERRDGERERRVAEAISQLQRAFPGVRGRLSDLVTVPHRKYRLAVTVALGRWGDAVVTEDDQVARDAIKHLKEQRLERLVFIPLRNIRASNVDERLRRMGGSTKLVLDCVEAQTGDLQRALLHALGNTLVCDTHEEAKTVAYNGTERHKVVSLDGTLIAAWGGITGGASEKGAGGAMAEGSTRFDRVAYDALKAKRAGIEAERAALPGPRACAEKEEAAQSALAGASRTLAALQADMAATARKVEAAVKDRTALLKERAKLVPELERAREQVATHAEVLSALRARADEITDRICAAFCAKVGAPNIRAFEQQTLHTDEKAAALRRKHSKDREKLQNDLDYLSSRQHDAQVKRVQDGIAKLQAKLEEIQAAGRSVQATAAAAAAAVEKAKEALAGARRSVEDAEREAATVGKAAKQAADDVVTAKRHLAAKQAELAALAAERESVLRECAVDGLVLPQTGGSEAAAATGSTPAEGSVDFSRLPRVLRTAAEAEGAGAARERARLESEMRAELEVKSAQLEKLAPNLKAVHQYEAVKAKEAELAAELETAKSAARAASEAFASIKAKRYSAFMAAYTHVARVVDPIYKSLTRGGTGAAPGGAGSAELMLENPAEPFLHGVRYMAMPPTKRFRDMEQLSGGEKTVAALALLFAVHSFRPSPFFVLDEIDAALDKVNVERVARFIREAAGAGGLMVGKTRVMKPFQSIVISLKDTFYDKADALVGVFRDAAVDGNSRTLTLDLGAYA